LSGSTVGNALQAGSIYGNVYFINGEWSMSCCAHCGGLLALQKKLCSSFI
jgi:hypothetical protein